MTYVLCGSMPIFQFVQVDLVRWSGLLIMSMSGEVKIFDKELKSDLL